MRVVQPLHNARLRTAKYQRVPASSATLACVHEESFLNYVKESVHAAPTIQQYIEPIEDMKAFDSQDAQLNLANGTPRFYIMRLPLKPSGLQFTQITHHKKVTQCLGSLTPEDWYMAVAKPGIETLALEDVAAFKVPFGAFIKMHAGTWHAGPHFEDLQHMDFYNLELADTNQVDHYNFHFDKDMATAINILPC